MDSGLGLKGQRSRSGKIPLIPIFGNRVMTDGNDTPYMILVGSTDVCSTFWMDSLGLVIFIQSCFSFSSFLLGLLCLNSAYRGGLAHVAVKKMAQGCKPCTESVNVCLHNHTSVLCILSIDIFIFFRYYIHVYTYIYNFPGHNSFIFQFQYLLLIVLL